MRERLIGSLAVMDGDQLVGIVTATDVFDAIEDEPAVRLSQAAAHIAGAAARS